MISIRTLSALSSGLRKGRSAAFRSLVLLAACLGQACGEGDPGSGLPGSLPASRLTDDQARQLCESLIRRTNERTAVFDLELICTAAVAGRFDDAESCRAAVAICENDVELAEEFEALLVPLDVEATCSDIGGSEFAGCTVTVGELEACFDATLQRYDAISADLGALSCTEPRTLDDNVLARIDNVFDNPVCNALPEACL